MTIIRNRAIRDRIADRRGLDTVSEVSRWNDQYPGSLANYGVPVSKREEELQAQTYEQMAAVELLAEDNGASL